MRKVLRGAFVIARRDFTATVLSKTFLFFLLGPLFPLLFGGVFGGIIGGTASQRDKSTVAVIASQAEFAPLEAARDRLGEAIGQGRLVDLERFDAQSDVEAQQKRFLASAESTPGRPGRASRPSAAYRQYPYERDDCRPNAVDPC